MVAFATGSKVYTRHQSRTPVYPFIRHYGMLQLGLWTVTLHCITGKLYKVFHKWKNACVAVANELMLLEI